MSSDDLELKSRDGRRRRGLIYRNILWPSSFGRCSAGRGCLGMARPEEEDAPGSVGNLVAPRHTARDWVKSIAPRCWTSPYRPHFFHHLHPTRPRPQRPLPLPPPAACSMGPDHVSDTSRAASSFTAPWRPPTTLFTQRWRLPTCDSLPQLHALLESRPRPSH